MKKVIFCLTIACLNLFSFKASCQCAERDHFWCAWAEAQTLRKGDSICYHPEGFCFSLRSSDFLKGSIPLYRFYNPSTSLHFYSTSREEGTNAGYGFEGSVGYAGANAETPSCIPIYGFYNPTTRNHFYTPDKAGELATQDGYAFEGVDFYAWDLNHADMKIIRFYSPFGIKEKREHQDDAVWSYLSNYLNPPPPVQHPPVPPTTPTPTQNQCLGNGKVNFYNTNSQPLWFFYWYAEDVRNGADECQIRALWKQLSIGNNQFPAIPPKRL